MHTERKRFYRNVSVYKEENDRKNQYGVKLDQKNLRTPLRKMFLVPSEPLALAVAEEWQAQGDVVKPSLMHLTSLCNTVLDEHGNPRKEVEGSLMDFITTDTIR